MGRVCQSVGTDLVFPCGCDHLTVSACLLTLFSFSRSPTLFFLMIFLPLCVGVVQRPAGEFRYVWLFELDHLLKRFGLKTLFFFKFYFKSVWL